MSLDRASGQIQFQRTPHCATESPKHVNAKPDTRIDQLHDRFAWRVRWVYMPEKKVIRQSSGDGVKIINNEINVGKVPHQHFSSAQNVMDFNGDAAGERPARNVVPS
jgi:hypothetical protein